MARSELLPPGAVPVGAPAPELGRGTRAIAAALCALFFVLHAGNHASHGNPWDAFWACHWATLMIGTAAILKHTRLNSIGLCWLGLGNVLWIFDLLVGGDWMWTSTLTHWGGLSVGLWLARGWLGYARGSWWRAVVTLLLWQQFTRLITPRWRNVNLAFDVHSSSTAYFSSYALYWCFLVALSSALLWASEQVYVRVVPWRRAR